MPHMALRANAGRIRDGCLMRIVARSTGQPALRFQETRGLPETISLADNLKFVVMASVRSVIEILAVIAQSLPRLVGENTPVELHDGARQFGAGGFEMALHTHVKLPLGSQARRVDNCVANVRQRPVLPDSLGMFGA